MISDGYIFGVLESKQRFPNEITEAEKENVYRLLLDRPAAPSGYVYKLRADNLEWELVKLPPIEPEPLTDEAALTRYANELTGADDPDLISAAETMITKLSKEEP
jgi:hypothetical protein